jgi:hypothetical protein
MANKPKYFTEKITLSQKTTVIIGLTILIRIFDQNPQFLHAQLYAGGVIWHPRRNTNQHGYDRVDAFIQQTHSGSARKFEVMSDLCQR